ncbi:chemotaxis protein CheW [Solimonas marina]|uniref:Chemotaxis protein CheW n=1 Tax=Solimonas marina TaxID=2714601 RepID=A0A969W998_9GAMM|nr:chemotaxis protein CheW [Solimonas marina]NKF22348.1 chemotaxis protein CheW [Solimonas marina]
MSETENRPLYAVLMALSGDTLLLPNVAIAEVVARETLQPDLRLPAWIAGFVDWNSRRVPALRFEVLNGGAVPEASRRERVVVLNSSGRYLPSGQLAIVTQAYPHLVTLTRAALQPAPLRDSDRAELVLARTRVANQLAAIPDLDMIEAEVARALPAAAAAASG